MNYRAIGFGGINYREDRENDPKIMPNKHAAVLVGLTPEYGLWYDSSSSRSFDDYPEGVKYIDLDLLGRSANLFRSGISKAYVPVYSVSNK